MKLTESCSTVPGPLRCALLTHSTPTGTVALWVITIVLILQSREPRHREAKTLAQSCIVVNCRAGTQIGLPGSTVEHLTHTFCNLSSGPQFPGWM